MDEGLIYYWPLLKTVFGIVACILYGFGNGIEPLKPDLKVLRYFGSGMIWLFELVFGVWMLFFAHTIL